MRISWKWLSEFVDLKDISAQDLAHRLSMSGLEVASIENKGQGLESLVVGRLRSVVQHPNADKLSLTEVEFPTEILRIVCGAKNIAVGDVVPVALDGTVLPNGLKIKKTKIRGEESNGMICSESELGLAEKSEGILQLPKTTPLGTSVASLLDLDDILLEIEITPNRADCLSHLGIARHVSAILDRPLKLPAINLVETEPSILNERQVKLEENCGCFRYCARIVRNINISPSPIWMQRRLEAVGIRPLNNVVDITNYVLMEIGQPLHAFDLDKLQGNTINARRAKPGENLITLDGIERKLSPADLVIADQTRPVALAGVMGGANTEVTLATKNILLEAAWFEPKVVRQMSRRVQCSSESSYRFERGIDPELGLKLALDRAAQLMAELANGTILSGVIDEYSIKFSKPQIKLRMDRVNRVLGMQLDPQHAFSALSRLGFLVEGQSEPGTYLVCVPSFRHDVSIEEDLIEEIAEIIGYDKIPVRQPTVPMVCPTWIPRQEFIHTCRDLAAGLGLFEIINYSFHSPNHFDKCRLQSEHPWRTCVKIKNPISDESSCMRTSLLPSLIETVSYNQRRGQDRLYLYEIGANYIPQLNELLPAEPIHLGIALSGPRNPMYWRLGKKRPACDFYDLKGIIEGLMERLHIKKTISFIPTEHPYLHPLVSFSLYADDTIEFGWAGALHPEVQENYKLRDTPFVAEIDLEKLLTLWVQKPTLRQFSVYPSAVRDISLAVSEETHAGEVMKAIYSAGKELVTAVVPFDIYQGEELPAGTKSLAFSFTLQAFDRTLLENEVNQVQTKIINHLQSKFKATQR